MEKITITIENESLIGKKYQPFDNSWEVNITTASNYPYKSERKYLAGYSMGPTRKTCTIVSDPFEAFVGKSKHAMIMVEYYNETHMVLFFEDGVIN